MAAGKRKPPPRSARVNRHFVYLAATADGAYYCGYAADVIARIRAHNAGKGAKILRGKRPVRLAFARRFTTKSAALRFEALLKRYSHEQKRALSSRWRKDGEARRSGRL